MDDVLAEVLDILDMYAQVRVPLRDLPPDEGVARNPGALFRGFDGNCEGDHFERMREVFAEGRYRELQAEMPGNGNTHGPMLSWYQRMVECWRANFEPDALLTEEQAAQVVRAGWPDNE